MVRKVYARTGSQVELIELHKRDSTVDIFGRTDRADTSHVLRLDKDELITSVTQVERGEYLGGCVTFKTSKHQTMKLEGWMQTGKKWQTHTYAVDKGWQICSLGFDDSRLVFVQTVPANGKGDPRKVVISDSINRL